MNRTGSAIPTVLLKYLHYRIRARHKKGHGIHSPFVFEFVREVLRNSKRMELPAHIRDHHDRLLASWHTLNIIDHGAGSRVSSGGRRRVSSIARHSSVSRKYGKMLYRLSKWYSPQVILELGTGIGISTGYFGGAIPGGKVYTVEGSEEKSRFAEEQLQFSGIENIICIQDTFENSAEELISGLENHCLVFIDGNHRYEPTIDTVNLILGNELLTEVIIILDDIHWSNEMEQAWKSVCSDDRVAISVNLFFMGILLRRPGMKKQHFNITF